MGYIESLALGASYVFSAENIVFPIIGTLLAMVTSFLPGVGTITLSAFLVVLTVTWDPLQVLLLFGALTGGATFMGSITAILFNVPGSAPSAAALLDGYPMAQNGYPKTAIACAATASAIGSLIGVLVLIATLPIVRVSLLHLGPFEMLLIGLLGLTLIASLPNTSRPKAIMMAALGLLLATIGSDPVTGAPRWAFGSIEFLQGVSTIPLLLGLFTISELLSFRHRKLAATGLLQGESAHDDSTWNGVRAVFRHKYLTLRSAGIGTFVGVVPGVGGTVASFIAYGQAVQTAGSDSEDFGKGDIRGLIAPESAVDAKDGGSLLPAIALGLPGSEAGVMLVAVLSIHGLVPGQPMLTEQLPLTFALVLALLFSNILTSFLGIISAPWLAGLARFPLDRIALPGIIVCVLGALNMTGQISDTFVLLWIGVFGYVFKALEWPLVPLVIAFILGDFIETNFAISMRLIEIGRIQPLERPASIVLFVLFLLALYWLQRVGKNSKGLKPATKDDVILAGGILVIVLVASLAALLSGEDSSNYTYLSTLILMMCAFWVVGTYVRARVSTAIRSEGNAFMGATAEDLQKLLVVLSTPVFAYVAGVPFALGVLVFLWKLRMSDLHSPINLFRRLASGSLVTIGTLLLFTEVLKQVLPPGILQKAL